MMNAEKCFELFDNTIVDYHKTDAVDTVIANPFVEGSIEHVLYLKCWIDSVQWHYEDIIRDPNINPQAGMELKRKIDKSNQHRTDVVERLDDYFMGLYKNVTPKPTAKINTESPGWVVDRMSILCLKIYHMQEQVERMDTEVSHRQQCENKLTVLLDQKQDLTASFNDLLQEFSAGTKRIKVYRQMKMYNDDSLNPVLYKK